MQEIGNLVYIESLLLCFALLAVLFFANIRYWRPLIINRLSLIYIFVGLTIALYAIWAFADGIASLVWLNHLTTILSTITMTLSCMFYYYFVLKQVGITFKNGKWWYLTSFISTSVAAVFYIVSIWTGWTYVIDANSCYQRGPIFFIDIIASYSYVLCGIIFSAVASFKAELLTDKHRYFTFATAMIPSVVFAIINNLIPYPYGLPTVFFGIIISLLILFSSTSAGRVTRDHLTGLQNRFAFDAHLSQAVKRKGQNDLYLIMMDINGFKVINDTFGHAVGDEVLIKLSACIENVCEQYKATVGRWGGDEFIASVEANNDAVVQELVNALKEVVIKECNDDNRFTVSISAGVTKLREYETIKHFFEEADHKLYEDKRKYHETNQR